LRYFGHRGPFGRHAFKEKNEMKQLAHIVGSFWRDEDGQDLLEYALLVALIALVAVAGVTAAGLKVKDIFAAIAAAIPMPTAA
jgi:pilus assembly protein Flp/PilA